jgi:hypothetical protein
VAGLSDTMTVGLLIAALAVEEGREAWRGEGWACC